MPPKVRKDVAPIATTISATIPAISLTPIQVHTKILNWAHHLSSLTNEEALKVLALDENQNVRLFNVGNVPICCTNFN